MFPIPEGFIAIIALPSKSLATAVGLKLIDLMNIPYVQEGFRISLSETTLIVGTPCNGMRSLISFAALGMLAIHFAEISFQKSFVLLAAIYPLAILLNGFRIATLVYIAQEFGIDKASPENHLHGLSGLAVFIVGFLIILVVIRFLVKKG
jgi:exosortase